MDAAISPAAPDVIGAMKAELWNAEESLWEERDDIYMEDKKAWDSLI